MVAIPDLFYAPWLGVPFALKVTQASVVAQDAQVGDGSATLACTETDVTPYAELLFCCGEGALVGFSDAYAQAYAPDAGAAKTPKAADMNANAASNTKVR